MGDFRELKKQDFFSQCLILSGRKTLGHFCDVDNVHGLSVSRFDYRAVLFLSCPGRVTDGLV